MFLLITLGIVSACAENLAAQNCASPVPLTVNGCDQFTADDTTVWFSFNSNSAASWCSITMILPVSNPGTITAAELYSGTCTSLTLVQTGFNDLGAFSIHSGITASTNYLVKVTLSASSNGQVNICTNVIDPVTPCPPCSTVNCQLVCNPDLELYQWDDDDQHPTNFVTSNVCSWGTAGAATPDYFNVNATDPTVAVPSNFQGTEVPHSGSSYGGIYCYASVQGQYREYVQQQLQQPLINGQTYILTFWVSLSEYSGFAVSNIGAYISANQPTQTFPVVMNTFVPQIVGPNVITTTSGWVPITGTYQATGGEQWITIGSFEGDLQQQHPAVIPAGNNPYPSPPGNPNQGSYYFIDDITLEYYPDPFFTWSGTCRINFLNDLDCIDPNATHSWNFGDPASGSNNTSIFQNPAHTFTQNGVPYLVTHTITTPTGGVYTYTATVVQPGGPTANIAGYATNNCGDGTINYTATPCDPNIQYSWIVSGGSPISGTGCTINVNWGGLGGFIYLTAFDPVNDCFSYDTLEIPPCCHGPGLRIDNMTASQALSDPLILPFVTGGNTITYPNNIFITGVFTVDVPITFLNCPDINIGGNTPILVNPGQTLTFDDCTTEVLCDIMWDGIYLANVTSTVNIINGSVIQQAKNAVVSNSGGRYTIVNSTLQNNYRDIVVNAYLGTHPGVVRGTDFLMNSPFLTAVPAFPFAHNKTICAIEIYDNADITFGDATVAANRNRFNNVAVGVRSNNSNTKVINARFNNMNGNINIPNAGTGVVANGQKNVTYQAAITVGGTGLNRCVFTDMRIGVDVYDIVNVNILNNNISEIRLYGVRLQRCNQRTVNINDNNMTNAAVTYGFNTGFLLLECYQANVNIYSNTIIQTNTIPGQIGTGIRVSLVTPGDVILNIVNNVSISRVRTGVLLERLVGKDHVYVTNNAISFTKPNPNYTSPHHGVHLVDCGGKVRVEYNTIQKGGGIPNSTAMRDNLRGVMIQNSPTSIVAHNTITRTGTGIYGMGDCANSTLACNTLVRCYDGFFFTGPAGSCNIGDQVINPVGGNPAPTGNIWTNSVNSDINGGISPAIFWYRDGSYVPNVAGTMAPGSLIGPPLNQTTFSANPSACTIIPLFAPPAFEREQNAGEPVLNPTSTPGSEQGYIARQKAHQKLREVPSWMTLGTPQDSLYASFYNTEDNSNIGLFRNFEDMAAVDSVTTAGAILTTIVDTNVSEANLKTVYSIYQQTWMHGIYEFTPTDSMTLETIALQSYADAGEGVYAARVMLALQVDEDGSSSARYSEDMEEESVSTMKVFPNPATDQVTVATNLVEGQTGTVEITDIQGKVVQSMRVNGRTTILDVSGLDNGLYFVQLVVDGELVETNKLEVIHE